MAIGADPDRSAPLRPAHVIAEQKIDVAIARKERAFAVMERIGALNQARLLPLIERIFEEHDRPGEVIRIDRLELELGRFTEAEIGGGLERRFEAALREALGKAIPPPSRLRGPLRVVGETATVRSVGHALIECFEHWLLHGTWPNGAGLGLGAAPADVLARLIEDEPEALAAMLRRRGGEETVPRRLARQMPDPLLARLLERLEPASAHWVLGYMAETRAAHAATPLVEETPEEFGRTLWLIVLRDALHHAGLRANRRAFVGKLVGDIAATAGLSVASLLAQLKGTLAAVPAAGMGEGSLLSILAEIGPGAEEGVGPDLGAMARLLSGEATAPGEVADMLEAARLSHPEETRWLLRRLIRLDAAAMLRRLRGTVSVSGLLCALLGVAEAERWAKRLAGAGDEEELAALLGEAARAGESPGGPEATSEMRRVTRSGGDPMEFLRRFHAGTAAPEIAALYRRERAGGEAAADELARVKALLSDPGGDPQALHDAIATARAVDSIGLRRLLRRFAIADAGRLLSRLAPAVAAEAMPELLLAPHLAAPAGALIRAGRCSFEEGAELLACAAALPPAASASLLVLRLAETLARRRGRSGEQVLRSLHADSVRAGGVARRALAPLLERALRPAEAEQALARRQRTVDWLRNLLHRPGGGIGIGIGGGGGPARLASLAGTAAERLRAELQATDLGQTRAARALGRLDPASLLRLIALLAPEGGEGRRILRRRLADAKGPAALAVLAAELLVAGQVSAVAPAEEGESRPAAAGRLAAAEEEALALAEIRSGTAPLSRAARRSLALLIRRRPVELLGLLAARGGATERELLGDPLLARLLFERLPEAQRREAEILARLLTGPAARGGLSPDTLVRSLAAAALAAMRSPSGDFAAYWRSALLAGSSPGERRLLSRLLGPIDSAPPPPPSPQPGSLAWLLATLRRPPAERQRLLRAALRTDAFRRQLVRHLPPHVLVRLLSALRPHEAKDLVAAGALLREAIRAGGGRLSEEMLWEAQLAAALAPDGGGVARLLDLLLPASSAKAALARAAEAALGPLAAAIEQRSARQARRKPPPPPDEPRRPRLAAEADGGAIAVLNAGLVLTSPFLPQLFTALELVARDGSGKLAWTESEQAGRAVHILQYLVDGRCDAPEPLLALNKLLCGLDLSWPTLPGIVMTEAERSTCQSMLGAMIANWPMLSGSSVAALQETFLQREGRISQVEGGWKLEVERKVLDVLVDSVPWSFAMIFHSWMEDPISVSW
ncbi:MAG: hypothetical protein QOG72_1734 [Sphingomonadales bacterium]|nr:hypothetical protein [Sphingomonadales bacterium]